MVSDPLLQTVVNDAQWLAHRYEAPTDKIHFRHVLRLKHRDGPFLTDEYLGDAPLQRFPRQEAVGAVKPAPLHFIFHSAFCGSTLLTRAFDQPAIAMGLSEPVILNDIVGMRRRGEIQPPQVAQLLDHAMTLLARPFEPGEAVIVKPSNILNSLAGAMLAMRPQSKTVFLYAPLEIFLASVARKGLWCRLWVRELLEGMLREGAVGFDFTPDDYFRQTDLQIAAVGWLAQHQMFHRLYSKFGPERIFAIDSETLLARKDKALPKIATLFDLNDGAGTLIAQSDSFGRDSKTGAAYDAKARKIDQEKGLAAHSDEIEKVKIWAEAVAQSYDIALTFPNPL